MKQLVLSKVGVFIFLFDAIGACSQYESGNVDKNADDITNDSLRLFVKDFATINYPYSISKPNDEKTIDLNKMNRILHLNKSKEDIGLEEYYYGYVFFDDSFLGLIITHFYTPGAFGIENYFMELITLDYNGKYIDSEVLGCYCNDTNMGSNDYFSTDLKIVVDELEIKIFKRGLMEP